MAVIALLSGDGLALIALGCRSLPSWSHRAWGAAFGAVVGSTLQLGFADAAVAGLSFGSLRPYVAFVAAVLLAAIALKLLVAPPDRLAGSIAVLAIGITLLELANSDSAIAIAAAARERTLLIAITMLAFVPLAAIVSLMMVALLVSRTFKYVAAIVLAAVIALTLLTGGGPHPLLLVLELVVILGLIWPPLLVWGCAAILGASVGTAIFDLPIMKSQIQAWNGQVWMFQIGATILVVALGVVFARSRASSGDRSEASRAQVS